MTEWTVGMLVALKSGYAGHLSKETVVRMTASGLPVIGGRMPGSERMFNKNGRERGYKGAGWDISRIEPWTADHDAKVAKDRADHLAEIVRRAMVDLDGYAIDEITQAATVARAARLAKKSQTVQPDTK